jgi:hypothetical protein
LVLARLRSGPAASFISQTARSCWESGLAQSTSAAPYAGLVCLSGQSGEWFLTVQPTVSANAALGDDDSETDCDRLADSELDDDSEREADNDVDVEGDSDDDVDPTLTGVTSFTQLTAILPPSAMSR